MTFENGIKGLDKVALENLPTLEDVQRTCRDCGRDWTCTSSEQSFLREKFGADFKIPGKCIDCRRAARTRAS
jgi:hypothetical protein